jgi:hypothetical protein
VPNADLTVRLTPRANRDEITGLREDGVLLARVKAPPVDGRANEALCRLIAKQAGLARSAVTITGGHHAREKRVRVEGLDHQTLLARLAA